MKKPAPFGKYFLLERINVGGMAEVFRAKAFGVEGFERLVAVKRILPNIAEDKEFIRMFIDEAKLSVQLNHANIAQIFDLGVVEGAYYIALEHVHGRDLRGIFDRCRQLAEAMPVAQACFVVMKICEGLDYAHNKRDQGGRELSLVHRDVSPQNILVSFEGEVKIIDFGIAKAAGKGSKTQAGILKGKFGYMSPEQVRGLPIDRRSDVFSCGIVLYELLTGERLFVGESDFSTLEKVRNVEILPPSTYNRKIPDELERIVLKALAKDVEDRYQNAIDLHDELQAFVYTAGEFYSRKELAGWMKKTFGKEIEEETAKLEAYRQLKPPPEVTPSRTATGTRPPVSDSKPPPTPAIRRTTSAQAIKPPPPPTRTSQQMPVVDAAPAKKQRKEESGDLAWDDDELETQIYDDQPGDAPAKAAKGKDEKSGPNTMPALKQPSPTTQGLAVGPADSGPDLSGLAAATSKGWEKAPPAPPPPSPSATMNGIGLAAAAPKLANGTNKDPLSGSVAAIPSLASASGPSPAHSAPVSAPFPMLARETSAPAKLISAQDSLFDPMSTFGSGVTSRKDNKKTIMLIAIGGAALVAIVVVIAVAMSNKSKTPSSEPPVATKDTPAPVTNSGNPPPAPGDQNTGFDLYVTPAGVTNWKLDGEPRTDRLPSRIRGISPGVHKVAIDPPPGFMNQEQTVTVEAGKSPKVEITLQGMAGIVGVFESTPPADSITLIYDGKREKLAGTPAKAPLDPHVSYTVLFEKAGYVNFNKPVQFTGATEEKVVVNLEKIAAGSAVAAVNTPPNNTTGPVTAPPHVNKPPVPEKVPPVVAINKPPVEKPPVEKPPVEKPPVEKPPVEKPPVEAKGEGTLAIGSKPVCDIFVDGADTGKHTPTKDIKLSSGGHKITLVNNEFGIKETFAVTVKANDTTRVVKDFSDKLPK